MAEINLAGVLDESNSNLSLVKKLLLHWHCYFYHKGMSRVQVFFRALPFLSKRFKIASWVLDLPLYETCKYAKAHRLPTKGAIQSTNPDTNGAIHEGHLRAGNLVTVDHFESRLKGRTYESMGGMNADKNVGGFILANSMSSFCHVEHQLGFSGSDTTRAK